MCTAISYKTTNHYFGRNLDLESSYGEEIVITPRNYPLVFRKVPSLQTHYAIIGSALVMNDYPLYYDGTNEMGLSMAGLNFPGNAFYPEYQEGKSNIAPFEFLPWVLGLCGSVVEAKALLTNLNLVNIPFHSTVPLSPLHFMIADCEHCIVVESTTEGLKVYDNPVKILTNNPPFRQQLFHLNNYQHLSNGQPSNTFDSQLPLHCYSRGMGALGLPGDFSSQSRFVRGAFVLANTKKVPPKGSAEHLDISQFFHLLSCVQQPYGSVDIGNQQYQHTIYSSCCDTQKGIYYYTTYENHQISAVQMRNEKMDGDSLIRHPFIYTEQIQWQN